MKCKILFSGKNKKNIINLLSAELAQRVIKVTRWAWDWSSEYCNLLEFINRVILGMLYIVEPR